MPLFYRVGDWDDLQIYLNVSLHDGFKIQFAGVIPVFLDFNGWDVRLAPPRGDLPFIRIHTPSLILTLFRAFRDLKDFLWYI